MDQNMCARPKKYTIMKKRSIRFNENDDIVSEYEDVEVTDDEDDIEYVIENENYEKIQDYLIKNYDSNDIIKSVLQINVSTWKPNLIIEINKCINKKEVIIIIYKTGNVYTMSLTPQLTLQNITEFMIYETSCFINEPNKYKFILDNRWFCELYNSTFEILHMPFDEIEFAQGDLFVV